MSKTDEKQTTQLLYALQTLNGEYSRIGTLEQIQKLVEETGLRGTVGIVQFIPVCPTEVRAKIRWDLADESLKAGLELNGAGAPAPETNESAMRAGSGSLLATRKRRGRKGRGVPASTPGTTSA